MFAPRKIKKIVVGAKTHDEQRNEILKMRRYPSFPASSGLTSNGKLIN